MLSEASEKTYKYYLNCYKRWCEKSNLDEQISLDDYKTYLKSIKRSDAYIRNSVNLIAKKKNIPLTNSFETSRLSEKFNCEEIKMLKNISKKNYKSEEISLLLLILLETNLKIKDILILTKLDIHNILTKKETLKGKKIPNEALYIFEYLLSVIIQKNTKESFFTKTYHSYLHNFKSRQKELFPNKPYRTFNGIHIK